MNTHRVRPLLITASLGVLLALGMINLINADDSSRSNSLEAKTAPSVAIDPDAGLTDDQIRAKDWAMINAQRERDNAFVDAWEKDGKDARGLDRVPILAEPECIPTDLREALRRSELVARVRVDATHFQGEQAIVELQIVEVMKGEATSSTLTLYQGGGPRLDEPSGKIILAEMEWDPILLPADEAVVFLSTDPSSARWVTVPGQNYRIEAGRVVVSNVYSAMEDSELAGFGGTPANELVDAIRRAVR